MFLGWCSVTTCLDEVGSLFFTVKNLVIMKVGCLILCMRILLFYACMWMTSDYYGLGCKLLNG